jgi:UDP-2,4-diacetamido-2,4,6-trideoxy-beta-L-altropyranose hydrolase
MGQLLLFRADAGVRLGTGHVMRCLALAQAWLDRGGQAAFAMTGEPSAIVARLATEHCLIERQPLEPGSAADARWTIGLAHRLDAAWLIADGYRFGTAYQQAIKETGARLLVLDDYGHAEHYWADLVLNQNIYATDAVYARREAWTRLLLGTQFALLRREFLKWRGWRRPDAALVRNVLVTLGGSDPDGVTGRVIEALERVRTPQMRAVVVVGSINPHLDALNQYASVRHGQVELKCNVTDMPALMAQADLAISASGSTCWELAFFGLPICCVILADNQVQVAECLSKKGAAVNLGRGTELQADRLAQQLAEVIASSALRARMSETARSLVDGQGSQRVLQAMGLEARVNHS